MGRDGTGRLLLQRTGGACIIPGVLGRQLLEFNQSRTYRVYLDGSASVGSTTAMKAALAQWIVTNTKRLSLVEAAMITEDQTRGCKCKTSPHPHVRFTPSGVSKYERREGLCHSGQASGHTSILQAFSSRPPSLQVVKQEKEEQKAAP
jgi:hypothetical protein